MLTKGLILCGGRGTRLRPLTFTTAKHLLQVANHPILFDVVDDLVEAGLRDIGVVVSPETGRELAASLGDGTRWGARFTFITQPEPLGSAHAVRTARGFLGDSSFVVYLGDCLVSGGIGHLLSDHLREGVDASILVAPVEKPGQFGVAVVGSDGRVVQTVEKAADPPSKLALAGVYVFGPAVHEAVARVRPGRDGEFWLTDAIQILLEGGGRVAARRVRGWWVDTGTPESLLEANRLALSELCASHLAGEVEDSHLAGAVVVEKGARVRRSSVRGPVHIAAGAVVDSSHIGPYTSVGRKARVIRSDVEHSIIFDEAQVSDLGWRLDAALVGRGAVVRGDGNLPRRQTIQLILGDQSHVSL